VILLGVKICCSAREKAMKKPIYARTEPFFELLSGVDSLCKLGNQFASVISTLDAFFTKVKGQLPLSAWFTKYFSRLRTQTPNYNVFCKRQYGGQMPWLLTVTIVSS
jgi:hypothetical protein